MELAIASGDGGLLDSAGRQILVFAEYRNLGVLIVLTLLVFVFWRRQRFSAWPSVEDCISVCTTCLAIIGGLVVGVVFLLTKPPAIQLLSQHALLTIGILVPIVSFGYAFPRLRALFSPPARPIPPTEKPPEIEQ